MSFARSLLTVSGLTVVSRIAGFARDALTAVFLGAGVQADAFFVAQRLPNLFRTLFAEGAFSAAFVPLYTTAKEKSGDEAARRFAGEALAFLVALLTPLTIAFVLFMPLVIRAIAPGFSDEPEKYDLAVRLSRITFPYLLLVSVTALQTGVLNARGIFGPGAAAPIVLNVVLILCLWLAERAGFDMTRTLAWGMIVAGVLQTAWLAASCVRARAALPLLRPRLNEATRRLFRQVAPGAIGAGAAQINLLLTTILASLLPTGAVSYLYYADRLNQLPLGIVGIAVATTLLPVLSQHEAHGDATLVRHYVSRAIEFCLALGLPASVGLGLAAEPIITTLFEHGAFMRADTVETARALTAYAFGVPAFLLVKVLTSRFFARHDTKTPVKIALISMATNVTLALLLLSSLQHVGMALAMSVATWTNAGLLFLALKKRDELVLDAPARARVPRLFLAALGMAVLTALLVAVFEPFFTGALTEKIAALCGVIGLSMAGYFVLGSGLGAFCLRDMARIFTRKE